MIAVTPLGTTKSWAAPVSANVQLTVLEASEQFDGNAYAWSPSVSAQNPTTAADAQNPNLGRRRIAATLGADPS